MRKCTPIVFFDGKNLALHELHILTANGENIQLVAIDPINIKHPYNDETSEHLTKSIINICKQNGFYVPYVKDFGGIMYNIVWVDINNPCFKYRSLLKDIKI